MNLSIVRVGTHWMQFEIRFGRKVYNDFNGWIEKSFIAIAFYKFVKYSVCHVPPHYPDIFIWIAIVFRCSFACEQRTEQRLCVF